MKKILTLVLIVLLFSNYPIQESFAKISIKKVDEKRCIHMYSKFLKMGEERFLKRYPAYPIMDKCMMLFKDSVFISKYSPIYTLKTASPNNFSYETKIITSKVIGSNKILTNFSICYEENKRTNYVLINSDSEKIFGKAQRLPDKECPSFWIVIKATTIQNTQFSWDYEHKPNPQIERKMF
ncbi:hypothetical protein Nisw_07365 [Candidatus Nitrosopumilus sp. SW]|uniref:hypothetical protein n=1 Tax=Candidatus Nitrosopumilus sp. SW TaxID=2508726 RepID=UPI001152E82A|nr:hypothetical protein [Candidatus Nitrosopumilus sp. SW]QDI89354.1 hypothetical protein Nisw_07365 [Candidatus Nitrosopumilus sp. SW]